MESVEEVAQCVQSSDGKYLLIIARELHERLLLRNEQVKQVHLPEVYLQHENAKKNVATWMNSQFIADAVSDILHVGLCPRSLVCTDA